MAVLVLRDDIFLEHDPGPYHPENAGRLEAIYQDLDAAPPAEVMSCKPRPATREMLARVHTSAYLEFLAGCAGQRVRFDADTQGSERTVEVATAAAGAAVDAVSAVVSGEAKGAFALVRPPGHHAEANKAVGFCVFNNIAVAAAHAVALLNCRRVLILDPDVHHGNGTQHLFAGRADVLYVSSHRYPFYPGTGAVTEIGSGAGLGYTVNLPVLAGTGDADLLHLYRTIVDPLVRAYRPDLILVSAGFDAFQRDPLGGLAVSERGFRALYALFREWADLSCPGRLACVLEGGYEPAGLVLGVRAALEAMATRHPEALGFSTPVSGAARAVADQAKRILRPYWATLQ